ncbi:MAG: Uma2 family endonuclease [Gemmataceae bacterium]
MNLIPPIVYPESDGKPMSDNTRQFRWIQTLAANIAALFHDRADVFVCGNQNWYPVQGHPEIVAAPDVYAVFGRPKGDRGSYKQWEEGGVPMTVVFEVLSPSNSPEEMRDKLLFYDDYGVEEYYVFDPDHNSLEVYVRGQATPRRMRPADGFVSPRLGIRFDLSGPELVVYRPDGQPFITFEELQVGATASDGRRKSDSGLTTPNSRPSDRGGGGRVAELSRRVLRAGDAGRGSRAAAAARRGTVGLTIPASARPGSCRR